MQNTVDFVQIEPRVDPESATSPSRPISTSGRPHIDPDSAPNRHTGSTPNRPRLGPESTPVRLTRVDPRSTSIATQIDPQTEPNSTPDRPQLAPRSTSTRPQLDPQVEPRSTSFLFFFTSGFSRVGRGLCTRRTARQVRTRTQAVNHDHVSACASLSLLL